MDLAITFSRSFNTTLGKRKKLLRFFPLPPSPLLFFFFFSEISSLWELNLIAEGQESMLGAFCQHKPWKSIFVPTNPYTFSSPQSKHVAHWKKGNYRHSNRWLGPHRKERLLGFTKTVQLAAWQGDFLFFYYFFFKERDHCQFSMGNAFENWNEKERY